MKQKEEEKVLSWNILVFLAGVLNLKVAIIISQDSQLQDYQ